MKGLKALTKQRAQWSKADTDKDAGIVNFSPSNFAVIKKIIKRDWEGFKTLSEILQEVLFSIRSDKEQTYGVVDWAVVNEAYDRMHKTTFLDRSQHSQIADFLTEFIPALVTSGDKAKLDKLVAIISWHTEQGGRPSVVEVNIDELFPEPSKTEIDTSIDAGLTRIMS